MAYQPTAADLDRAELSDLRMQKRSLLSALDSIGDQCRKSAEMGRLYCLFSGKWTFNSIADYAESLRPACEDYDKGRAYAKRED